MKRIKKWFIRLIIIDYFRACIFQVLNWCIRYKEGNGFWEAWRKVCPNPRDTVIFYEDKEV